MEHRVLEASITRSQAPAFFSHQRSERNLLRDNHTAIHALRTRLQAQKFLSIENQSFRHQADANLLFLALVRCLLGVLTGVADVFRIVDSTSATPSGDKATESSDRSNSINLLSCKGFNTSRRSSGRLAYSIQSVRSSANTTLDGSEYSSKSTDCLAVKPPTKDALFPTNFPYIGKLPYGKAVNNILSLFE